MESNGKINPWVSFCMSTYKRPDFLKMQIAGLLQQTFPNFEIVISDNDPQQSGASVAKSFNDPRVKYFSNGENLGMVQSFNKSIDRAVTDHVVMITDDDPVVNYFLEEMFQLYNTNKDSSLYGGFLRKNNRAGKIENVSKDIFLQEILDINKTHSILWSSCVMKRDALVNVGKMPDYGSPHLADHALIAMVGAVNGGMIINKMYSSLSSHDNNFSKFNLQYYTTGCMEFYKLMIEYCTHHENFGQEKKAVIDHIGKWFIACMYNLKRYYTINRNAEMLNNIDLCADEILSFPFMRTFRTRYFVKGTIFKVKKILHFL